MAKNIAVSDDVYEMLSRIKMRNESFSDVIRRLIRQRNISDIPKILSDREAETIMSLIEKQKDADMKRAGRLM
ncbi:antitoxin VapB family protein [Geoglobus sp.]